MEVSTSPVTTRLADASTVGETSLSFPSKSRVALIPAMSHIPYCSHNPGGTESKTLWDPVSSHGSSARGYTSIGPESSTVNDRPKTLPSSPTHKQGLSSTSSRSMAKPLFNMSWSESLNPKLKQNLYCISSARNIHSLHDQSSALPISTASPSTTPRLPSPAPDASASEWWQDSVQIVHVTTPFHDATQIPTSLRAPPKNSLKSGISTSTLITLTSAKMNMSITPTPISEEAPTHTMSSGISAAKVSEISSSIKSKSSSTLCPEENPGRSLFSSRDKATTSTSPSSHSSIIPPNHTSSRYRSLNKPSTTSPCISTSLSSARISPTSKIVTAIIPSLPAERGGSVPDPYSGPAELPPSITINGHVDAIASSSRVQLERLTLVLTSPLTTIDTLLDSTSSPVPIPHVSTFPIISPDLWLASSNSLQMVNSVAIRPPINTVVPIRAPNNVVLTPCGSLGVIYTACRSDISSVNGFSSRTKPSRVSASTTRDAPISNPPALSSQSYQGHISETVKGLPRTKLSSSSRAGSVSTFSWSGTKNLTFKTPSTHSHILNSYSYPYSFEPPFQTANLPKLVSTSRDSQSSNANPTPTLNFHTRPTSNQDTLSNTRLSVNTLSSLRRSSFRVADPSTMSLPQRSSLSSPGSSAWTSTAILTSSSILSATQGVEAPPPAAPQVLTPPQTVGIATASFVGFLLSAIAAVFLFRRYRSARLARSSGPESSVGPRDASSHDPPVTNGISREGDDDETTTFGSGGAGILPPQSGCGEPPYTPASGQGFGGVTSPFTDPENPFRYSDTMTCASTDFLRLSLNAPVDSDTMLYTTLQDSAIASHTTTTNITEQEYLMAAQCSPPNSGGSTPTQMFHTHAIPSPTLSPFIGTLRRSDTRVGSNGSARSILHPSSPSTYSQSSADASGHRVRSSQGLRFDYSGLPRESGACSPLTNDVLLSINSKKTGDSALTSKPPVTSKVLWQNSLPSSRFDEPVVDKPPFTTFNPRGPYRIPQLNPGVDSATATVNQVAQPPPISISNTQTTSGGSIKNLPGHPISPTCTPYAPTHRGWDDFKRMSQGSSAAAPLADSTPMTNILPFLLNPSAAPPAKKKKSLLQLRRKDASSPNMKDKKSENFSSPKQRQEIPLEPVGHVKSSCVSSPGLNLISPSRNKQGLGLRHIKSGSLSTLTLSGSVPPKPKQGLGISGVEFEGPKESFLARVNSLAEFEEGNESHGFGGCGADERV